MTFTNLEMWLLGWFILIFVLGNLALLFSLFTKTEKISEKLIFITMGLVIPLLAFFWILNEIFERIDSRKKKKREGVLSKFINKKNWVDAYVYLNNLPKAPTWVIEALEEEEMYFVGPDLIVKTDEGDIKVMYDDVILKYEDNTLGVMPKELTPRVSAHE